MVMKEKKRKQIEKRKIRRKDGAAKDIQIESKNIFFVGLKELDYADQKLIKDILYDAYIKIERELKLPGKMKFHFKRYKKGGREKFSVHLFLDFPSSRPIVCTRVYDPVKWDAVAAVHLLLKKARAQVVHKFKTDTSYQKSYY